MESALGADKEPRRKSTAIAIFCLAAAAVAFRVRVRVSRTPCERDDIAIDECGTYEFFNSVQVEHKKVHLNTWQKQVRSWILGGSFSEIRVLQNRQSKE